MNFLCPLAPRNGISSATAQRQTARSARRFQSEPTSSERPFALLNRLPASGPPIQGQCSWPIPSDLRLVLPGPFDLPLLHVVRFAPESANSTRPARFRFLLNGLSCSPTLHSRLGLATLPDQSVRAIYQPRGPPKSKRPIFPRSPLPAFFRRSSNGSMFRIRYFLPGSLSFEPLGTRFIMHLNETFVNWKC